MVGPELANDWAYGEIPAPITKNNNSVLLKVLEITSYHL